MPSSLSLVLQLEGVPPDCCEIEPTQEGLLFALEFQFENAQAPRRERDDKVARGVKCTREGDEDYGISYLDA